MKPCLAGAAGVRNHHLTIGSGHDITFSHEGCDVCSMQDRIHELEVVNEAYVRDMDALLNYCHDMILKANQKRS